jgi:hypothetical protein
MEHLPAEQRAVVESMYFEGRTQATIALRPLPPERSESLAAGNQRGSSWRTWRWNRERSSGHDRLEEPFAAEALGGTDDDGRHELREILTRHDSNRPECARLRSDYSEVAASLALSLEPVPMSGIGGATLGHAHGRSGP